MQATGVILALLASIFWAICAFPFTSAGRSMSVASMNLMRLVLGTVFVFIAAAMFDWQHLRGIVSQNYLHAWLWLAASGITAIGIGDYFSYRMYTIIGPRNGSALATVSPAAAFLFGIALLNEHLDIIGLAGMAVTITGILSLSLGRTERSNLKDHGHGSLLNGIFYGVIGSACNGAGIVFSKKAFIIQAEQGDILHPLTASFIRFFTATVVVLIFTFFSGKTKYHLKNIIRQPARIKGKVLLGILFGPVLGVSFALWSIQYINVAVAQTIFALVPAVALLIAHFVYHEKITRHALAGVFISVAGVAILVWRIRISSLLGIG